MIGLRPSYGALRAVYNACDASSKLITETARNAGLLLTFYYNPQIGLPFCGFYDIMMRMMQMENSLNTKPATRGRNKMTVFVRFANSIYNCEVIVKDSVGTRKYFVDLTEANEERFDFLEIDVKSGDFELTVLPQMADYKAIMSEMEITDRKDRLAKKIGNAMLSFADSTMLRVGCKYRVSGLKDGNTIFLCQQEYVFGTFDRFDLLGLLPMAYMFFEASYSGCRFDLSDAFELNRKAVISTSRKIALTDVGLQLILTYPLQVGRIKRLSKNKKIKRTLIKFNRMNEEQRQRVLEKKEKFMSRL